MELQQMQVRTTESSAQEGRLKVDAGKRSILKKLTKKKRKKGH